MASKSPDKMTNPARDLIDLCAYATSDTSLHSDDSQDALAAVFGVGKWSKEFFAILEEITKRIEHLRLVIAELELDEDLAEAVEGEINAICKLFETEHWSYKFEARTDEVSPENLRMIRLIEPRIASIQQYPAISDEERAVLCDDIDQLILWLSDRQMQQNDFIREALIKGLQEMRFAIDKMRFFGWAYAAASLRGVIAAYMALERMEVSPANTPDAEAVLKKVRGFCEDFYSRMKMAKDFGEVADFSLRLYGAASLALTSFRGVAGYLN